MLKAINTNRNPAEKSEQIQLSSTQLLDLPGMYTVARKSWAYVGAS